MVTTDREGREQSPTGEVRGSFVYPTRIGKPSESPIRRIGPGGEVFPYILGPGPKNPVPIGRVRNGKYYPTIIGGVLNASKGPRKI